VKSTHQFKVLDVRSAAIGFGLGVDARRADLAYGMGDVPGSKTTSQYRRNAYRLDDAAADTPIVGDTKRPDLAI
jgi:hypothetical protein